jgi:hypothetical protein
MESASIIFSTGGDDKDDDTELFIEIRGSSGRDEVVASAHQIYGKFPDHSVSEAIPIYLTDVGRNFRNINNFPDRIVVRIEPNGNDTWKFSFILTVRFEDGHVEQRESGALAVNQNKKSESISWARLRVR